MNEKIKMLERLLQRRIVPNASELKDLLGIKPRNSYAPKRLSPSEKERLEHKVRMLLAPSPDKRGQVIPSEKKLREALHEH